MTDVHVHVFATTHWLNGWFLRVASRPYVVVDGREQEARWGSASTVAVEGGRSRVGVGVRYLGRGALLGLEATPVEGLADGTALVFRNGPWNHDPFRLARTAPPAG